MLVFSLLQNGCQLITYSTTTLRVYDVRPKTYVAMDCSWRVVPLLPASALIFPLKSKIGPDNYSLPASRSSGSRPTAALLRTNNAAPSSSARPSTETHERRKWDHSQRSRSCCQLAGSVATVHPSIWLSMGTSTIRVIRSATINKTNPASVS